MKKRHILFATALMLMASCANDNDLSLDAPSVLGDGSISFNMNMPAISRSGGETSNTESGTTGTTTDAAKGYADQLHRMFIVWGEKNETNGTKADDTNTVFKNYVVKYTENTANTTTSNTANWEYVGYTPYTSSQVSPSILTDEQSTTKQTIKYWDDQATSYTFTAISALDGDIAPTGEGTTAKVVITKNTGTASTSTDGQNNNNSGTVYDKGYTVEVKSGANVDSIFYSDRKNISKPTNGYDHNAVQLTFRNFMSKVRFGIYEIVPGYKVVITGIKYVTSESETKTHPETTGSDDSQTTDNTFGITGNFIIPGENTKFTVTYEDNNSNHENKAKVALVTGDSQTPASCTYLNTKGTTWLTTTDGIGTAANAPTWDYVTETTGTDGNSQSTSTVNYTTILPNPSNTTNLKLQISYKLISEDTGEVIEFKEQNGETKTEIFRTVEVPAEYCQWKSNYAYSYLFKITDKSADLYPITFDAVVVSEETGKAETITTVTTPSITTIASRTGTDNKTTIVSGENEYVKGDVIYATVMDGSSLASLTVDSSNGSSGSTTGNIQLYTVTTTDAKNYPITEASVAHALSQTNGTTTNVKATKFGTNSSGITESDNLSKTVPAEDGTTITLDSSNNKALKWTAADNTVYAIEYTKTDSTNNSNTTKTYKIVRINGATGETTSTSGDSDGGSGGA